NSISHTLYGWLPLFSVLAAGSMLLGFFSPLALFNKRWGRVWAVNTFLMHWGILAGMKITFSYQLSGVMFSAFFSLQRVLEVVGQLLKFRAPTKPDSQARPPHTLKELETKFG